jgi:hypothetical protein
MFIIFKNGISDAEVVRAPQIEVTFNRKVQKWSPGTYSTRALDGMYIPNLRLVRSHGGIASTFYSFSNDTDMSVEVLVDWSSNTNDDSFKRYLANESSIRKVLSGTVCLQA